MAKNNDKLNEVKVLDGILQMMLKEHLDITARGESSDKYSTFHSIFNKVKKKFGDEVFNQETVQEKEIFFRKLWYFLKGAKYIQDAKTPNIEPKTYKITEEGIIFITIGGYEKRYENRQSSATKIAIVGGKSSIAFGILAIFFSTITTIQSCNANDKRLNLILEDSKEIKMQINDQKKEINFLRMQIDSLSQVQLQQSDSTKTHNLTFMKQLQPLISSSSGTHT